MDVTSQRRTRWYSLAAATAVVCVATPLTGLTSPAAAASDGGTFSVLTYNVAGLPEGISGSHPQKNTPVIGQRVRAYDIVGVQEDFNYHDSLYGNDDHPYRTPTSGPAVVGDGLNIMSRYPFGDFHREAWKGCHGTDCLTPKGFSVAHVQLAPGAVIDLYDLHANAGNANDDHKARRDDLTQLRRYMGKHSAGHAVIVMGDTNARYTDGEDNVRELVSDEGLTDAWVQLVRGGVPPAIGSPKPTCDPPLSIDLCEVVDKVFYRGSADVQLTAAVYHNEDSKFLDQDGKPLSDHAPQTVRFSWQSRQPAGFRHTADARNVLRTVR